MTGIYKIVSPSGKIYIGQSRDIYKRWSRHRRYLATTCKLHSSFDKYGPENHKFSIILNLPETVTDLTLSAWEIFFIKAFKDHGYKMLNMTTGGECGPTNPEIGLKIAASNKGREPWNKGLKNIYTEKTREAIRIGRSKQVINHSEETKRKIGLKNKYKYLGENSPTAKLTASQVKEIRFKYRPQEYTMKMLANEYGINISGINAIIHNRSWKHI